MIEIEEKWRKLTQLMREHNRTGEQQQPDLSEINFDIK